MFDLSQIAPANRSAAQEETIMSTKELAPLDRDIAEMGRRPTDFGTAQFRRPLWV